jgi:serine/threonine protein kinase
VEKEGASATVHQAEYRGRQVAAKKYRAIGGPDFVSERTILPYLRHPCIISLIGYVESESSCIIVMPWNEKGSLANAIRGTNKTFKENFNWRQFLRIAYDLADALNYLHTFKMNGTRRPIIHADVSSKNILLNSLNSGTERSIILTGRSPLSS